MGGTTIEYAFYVRSPNGTLSTAHLPLGRSERSAVLNWLGSYRAGPHTIDVSKLRLTQTSPPEYGVTLEWEGNRVELTDATAKEWASDLGRGQPGGYEASFLQ